MTGSYGHYDLIIRSYVGRTLAVLLPAREDLICMKVFAAADTGIVRHPSEGFRTMLVALLRYMDAQDEAEGLLGDA